jgi:hypothetical protein
MPRGRKPGVKVGPHPASIHALLVKGEPFFTTQRDKQVQTVATRNGFKVRCERCFAIAVNSGKVYRVTLVTPGGTTPRMERQRKARQTEAQRLGAIAVTAANAMRERIERLRQLEHGEVG